MSPALRGIIPRRENYFCNHIFSQGFFMAHHLYVQLDNNLLNCSIFSALATYRIMYGHVNNIMVNLEWKLNNA